ncbi:anticodon-binding aminoacyl-tRNA synthetase, class 1a [Tanacetum coccineum]
MILINRRYLMSSRSSQEKVTSYQGLESQVSVFQKQIVDLNDKVIASDVAFVKAKTKGKDRKKKIKSLSRILYHVTTEVNRLSFDLNQAKNLEALVQKFLASDEFSRVQGELLSLAANAGFECGLRMDRTQEPFDAALKKISRLTRPVVVPAPRAVGVPLSISKKSTVTPAPSLVELFSNDAHPSSAAPLEQNEEWLNVMVDTVDEGIVGVASDKSAEIGGNLMTFILFVIYSRRNMTTTTTTTDEDPQKHLLIEEENEDTEIKKQKLTPFSDLPDDQLMAIFGQGPPLRFDLCNAFLIYDKIIKGLQLFGTIQAAAGGFSPDPLLQKNGFFDIFNREFSNPVRVSIVGHQYLHDIRCSFPVSSTSVIQIVSKLFITTDKIDDVEEYIEDETIVKYRKIAAAAANDDYVDREPANNRTIDYCTGGSISLKSKGELEKWAHFDADLYKKLEQSSCNIKSYSRPPTSGKKKQAVKYIEDEAFHVCDDHAFITLSDKPNGGSGSYESAGKNGSLELCYVTLKYAVDADVEVYFVPPSKETKVRGRVIAYYGKGFSYNEPADYYYVTLFESEHPAFVKPGKLNLVRSMLPVPAKYSLIIKADLSDNTSNVNILSGTCEFPVPRDGNSSYDSIVGSDCSLKLKVDWKLPFDELKIPSSPLACSSNSSVSLLTERRNFEACSTSTLADPDQRNRWSLQEEIEKVFNTAIERTFGGDYQETVSCSISTCTKEDGGDYLCPSVLHIWPKIKNTNVYKGPNHAGLAVRENIMVSDYKDMMERCVVCGPGFVKFKLSRKWIAKSIHKTLTDGIDKWAPKLSVKKANIYLLSWNIAEEMHIGYSRSTFIGETLARMLEYSGVVVLRKRFHDWDHLEIEGKSFLDPYISKTLDSLKGKGLTIVSEGDEAVIIEGRKLPLVDLTALWHALNVEKADWILHVTDVGQRDYTEMCITAAKHAGWIGNDNSKFPLSHVGFGLVQGDDFERFRNFSTKVVNLANLLDEAKSRSRVLLARQGMADEWTAEELENAAEALGYGAVKYADLKNNRLTNYTFSFDQMLNEKGNTAVYLHYTHVRICSIMWNSSKDIKDLTVEELILKNDDERELGLHLLRFTEVLGEACTILSPHILCEYLYELCKKFNRIDSSVCQVVGSSEETCKLLMCKATEAVMKKCFDLLGITPICKSDI